MYQPINFFKQAMIAGVIALSFTSCTPKTDTENTDNVLVGEGPEVKYNLMISQDTLPSDPTDPGIKVNVGFRFVLESTSHPLAELVDSVTYGFKINTLSNWKIANSPATYATQINPCEGGKGSSMVLKSLPPVFGPDSSYVTFPTVLTAIDKHCDSDYAEVGGGLIVVLEEGLPVGPDGATFENVLGWKSGESFAIPQK